MRPLHANQGEVTEIKKYFGIALDFYEGKKGQLLMEQSPFDGEKSLVLSALCMIYYV